MGEGHFFLFKAFNQFIKGFLISFGPRPLVVCQYVCRKTKTMAGPTWSVKSLDEWNDG